MNRSFRRIILSAILVFSSLVVPCRSNAEVTLTHKWYYLEAIGGYNLSSHDVPIGLNFTVQKHRFGGFASMMYGFNNPETRYGLYASLGLSMRLVNDWSKVDAHLYAGPTWRVVETARDSEFYNKYSHEQQKDLKAVTGKWGAEVGLRFGGGKSGRKLCLWSGSIGAKTYFTGGSFEVVPQVGLSIVLGGAVAAGTGLALFWL